MNNKNYRVMKFFDSVNKQDKSRGYVRLDIRGIRGNIIVSVENLGDVKSASEVYLYKDRENKIKLGDINNKKGLLKKLLTFGSNNAIEDYNICAVVKDKKIVMYTNLFNACSFDQIRKLEADEYEDIHEYEEIDNHQSESSDKELELVNAIPDEVKQKEENVEDIKEVKKEIEKTNEKVQEVKQDAVKSDVIIESSEPEKNEPEYNLREAEHEIQGIKKTSVTSAVDINEVPRKQDEPEVESQARRYRNKFDESLYNVLKDYKQVEPLSVKIRNLYWWYIPYDETGIRNGFLPYYNQVISSYYPYPMSNRVTTCSSLMRKYGHYIFGVFKDKDEIVKFVYGVPGEFTKEEQPYKGITGFKNWSYSNKENYDKHGYWLAFVNPKTGETTEPPHIELS